MKTVILDYSTVSNNDISFSVFEKFGDVIKYPFTPKEKIRERIGDADILLTNKSKLGEAELSGLPNLKYIGLFATGYNNIDCDFCNKAGITVCNAPNYSTFAVAQHVFSLILCFYGKVEEYSSSVKNGDWQKCKSFTYYLSPTYELSGKTIGIIGYGSIGKKVAELAGAFEMKTLVHTRTPGISNEKIEFSDLDRLLRESDIITIHTPLTEETSLMINESAVSKMKNSAILINTSRGGVIDEHALAKALNEGRIAGAGLDVLSEEPMSADCELLNAKNCVITPHIAWIPSETRQRLVNLVADNIEAFLNGNPQNVINK